MKNPLIVLTVTAFGALPFIAVATLAPARADAEDGHGLATAAVVASSFSGVSVTGVNASYHSPMAVNTNTGAEIPKTLEAVLRHADGWTSPS